jgi:anti-sigma B factor antagonist
LNGNGIRREDATETFMQLEVTHHADTCIVTPLEKRIDAYLAPAFRAALLNLIDGGHVHLVVNLARVEFIDSSGLGALVSALKRLGRPGELKVCGLSDAVRSMFELTRLNRVIPITDSAIVASPAAAH